MIRPKTDSPLRKMDIPNKHPERVVWFLKRFNSLTLKQEQVFRLYYGLGGMTDAEINAKNEDGKNPWDGSSIEEIAERFDNTQEEIEDIKRDAVLEFTKQFLIWMDENKDEDEDVEYDLTMPTDPDFPSEDMMSENPTKTSILDFLDFNSKEKLSESGDNFIVGLLTEEEE